MRIFEGSSSGTSAIGAGAIGAGAIGGGPIGAGAIGVTSMGLGYSGVGSGADAGRARRTSISSTARSTQAGDEFGAAVDG